MTHPLHDITIQDHRGDNVRLGPLWNERPVVLLFVRHFGCIFCKEQLGEAERHRDELEALGAELVVVGNGSVEQAAEFVTEVGTGARVLTDPNRESYCAVDMKRTMRSSMNLKTIAHGVRACRSGFRQTKVAGDPFQQGGIVVMSPGDHERYRYVSEEAGDHPPFEQVLDTLRRYADERSAAE